MSDGFGKYDVYAVAGSVYCYRNSNVLRNKFDIHDASQLRSVEADISATRQTELMSSPVLGRFTVNHLCRIHKWLLGDVYSFAGHFRQEDIAKGETRFLNHNEIKKKLTDLCAQLHSEQLLLNLSREKYISRSAHYMAELNYIHPFREGNGRAVREFMRLLFLQSGYKVDWSKASVDELLQAMVESIYDTTHLEQVLNLCLSA